MTRKIIIISCLFFMFSLPVVYAQQPVHTVVRGDTLFGISRKYDMSVQELRALNNIDEEGRIYIGQELKLAPPEMEEFDQYTVVRGDTLYGLSRRFGTSVSEIRKINSLDSDMLRVGQKLMFPSDSVSTSNASSDSSQKPSVTDSADTDSQHNSGRTDTALNAEGKNEGADISSRNEQRWPHNGNRVPTNGKFPGVYISGEQGDDIVSVSSGRVIYSGPHSAFGHVVFVQSQHGYIYVYGGNASTNVKVGDSVNPGTVVGRIGTNPLTREQTVFFSIWKDDEFLHPDTAPRT
ncbi:LysM peptidoglycan-binding domain-containing protein [Spirochaeta dissipatitropha]